MKLKAQIGYFESFFDDHSQQKKVKNLIKRKDMNLRKEVLGAINTKTYFFRK